MTLRTTGNAPNALDVALGAKIRTRRERLGASQRLLAEAIGITAQQIDKYERGANRVSFSRLVDIAHALDCRVAEMIDDLDKTDIDPPEYTGQIGHLRVEGARELLAAYVAAPRPIRRAILKLVEALAARPQEFGWC